MPTYKVSCVIMESDHPGAIVNMPERPKPGQYLKLGDEEFEVIEVLELMPPRGEFNFLHVTCRPRKENE